MSLINKMNVGNTDYDIQDRLMPDAIGQAGQVLKVKDDGSGLEFSTIENFVKLYRHFIKMNDSIDGFSVVYFDSYRSTSYTFSELYNYIMNFVSYSFTALINLEDDTTAYLYNAKVEALNEKIIIWYSTTYGTGMSHRKSVTEVTSDIVIEL